MIRALIFDFDGLMMETEVAVYQGWRDTFAAYGADLPQAVWVASVGSSDMFDPVAYLSEQLGTPVERALVRQTVRERVYQMVAEAPLLPGVQAYLSEARALGLKLAVASSSSREWVEGHLDRHGLLPFFNCIRCSDDVKRTKPDPELYLSAIHHLGIEPHEGIVLEDSPNGVTAAKQAALFCVAVPGPLTEDLNFDHADLRLRSLADLPLSELLSLPQHGEPRQ